MDNTTVDCNGIVFDEDALARRESCAGSSSCIAQSADFLRFDKHAFKPCVHYLAEIARRVCAIDVATAIVDGEGCRLQRVGDGHGVAVHVVLHAHADASDACRAVAERTLVAQLVVARRRRVQPERAGLAGHVRVRLCHASVIVFGHLVHGGDSRAVRAVVLHVEHGGRQGKSDVVVKRRAESPPTMTYVWSPATDWLEVKLIESDFALGSANPESVSPPLDQ